ncbi:MAG: 16S rRNA processing protein RimM [Anaerolineae bacterium]|nr:16S rRNA processing protein RimM [Anaerolineae bacterium]
MTGPSGPSQKNMGGDSRSSGMRQPELRYLAIGRVIRAHGLRGEVSVVVLTDFPERFETTEWVYLGNEFEAAPYRLKSFRWHKQNVLLTLEGVTNRTQAELLKGQLVQVPLEEAVTLPDGSYYLYQLIGLKVEDTSGKFLGTIKEVLETGANDVYVVEHEGQELLLPAIPDVVKSVDITTGIMIVHLLDGLI